MRGCVGGAGRRVGRKCRPESVRGIAHGRADGQATGQSMRWQVAHEIENAG